MNPAVLVYCVLVAAQAARPVSFVFMDIVIHFSSIVRNFIAPSVEIVDLMLVTFYPSIFRCHPDKKTNKQKNTFQIAVTSSPLSAQPPSPTMVQYSMILGVSEQCKRMKGAPWSPRAKRAVWSSAEKQMNECCE